ncbi:hypothetical protein GWE18_28430 [Bradyrhizobium sp. CSA112]|uniref:hypothetical protein n=1 Tax=Bradyrhizobium sp. CSA112 TaxID=2699170 RepID=UPI0023B1E648|nr:hypothetical protein [Bradyrhizobium sp. CSA112]MDE5456685.1 hypothetical protein [Bradyrhizobium sp. CSA112]
MKVIAVMIDIADSAATNQNHGVLAAVGFSSFTISPSPSAPAVLRPLFLPGFYFFQYFS